MFLQCCKRVDNRKKKCTMWLPELSIAVRLFAVNAVFSWIFFCILKIIIKKRKLKKKKLQSQIYGTLIKIYITIVTLSQMHSTVNFDERWRFSFFSSEDLRWVHIYLNYFWNNSSFSFAQLQTIPKWTNLINTNLFRHNKYFTTV